MTTKFERTHHTITQAALELFANKGYEATSVGEIARSAGVSEMTFYRHFPSKQDAVLLDSFDHVIAEAVRRQPRSLPALQAIINGISEALENMPDTAIPEVRQRLRVIASSPELRVAAIATNYTSEQVIADAVVDRTRSRFESQIVAAAAIAALTVALIESADEDEISLVSVIEKVRSALGVKNDK